MTVGIARSRTVATPEGIFMRRPLRNVAVSWSDVAGIYVDSWRPSVIAPTRHSIRLTLRSGQEISLSGSTSLDRRVVDQWVSGLLSLYRQ